MPLDPSSLSSALAAVFASMPSSPTDAALALANAYRDYASTGTFGASLPVIVDPMRDALADTLEASIDLPLVGLPATHAAAWAVGVTAFWLAVPVIGASVGVTNGCPGASSLTGSLSGVFANLANTSSSCAASMATALDAATKTVTATLTPPIPPAAVPIA